MRNAKKPPFNENSASSKTKPKPMYLIA